MSRQLAGRNRKDFFETDPVAKYKLKALKTEIAGSGIPYFEYEAIETFGQLVLDTLWKRIEAELGQESEPERDWLEGEAELHELFMADRTRRFVGRRKLLDDMHQFAEGEDENSVMVITGEPGCGKSALMARFAEEVSQQHTDWLIIFHFVGASPASTNLRQLIRRFSSHLAQAIESSEPIPEDIKELSRFFPDILNKASEKHKILIILDAANQLERADDAHDMRWIPQDLPENVCLIISTLAGETRDALLARKIKPHEEFVCGLTAPEIKDLVKDYLEEVGKKFSNRPVEETFYEKIKGGSPLYILVALEELRVFGQFDDLSNRIQSLPETIPELFDQVLQRVEGDFNSALIRDMMSYIACGRYGMTAEELQTLLKSHAPQSDPSPIPDKLPDMTWARLYRCFSPYLFERSGVIDFFHGQLKEAVSTRYQTKGPEWNKEHQSIANYFEDRWEEPYLRALSELPYHRINSEDWTGLLEILKNLRFIELKGGECDFFRLINDYSESLTVIPDPISKKVLLEFKCFLSDELHFLRNNHHLVYQQAYNSSRIEVKAEAIKVLEANKFPEGPWLRKVTGETPQGPQGHRGRINCIAFFPDGGHFVTACMDGEVWLWNIHEKRVDCRFLKPPARLRCLAVSPSGNMIAGGYGAPDPDPFISGVIVWTKDGNPHCQFKLSDWVYGVDWLDDSTIMASGGIPYGSEANGLTWLLDSETQQTVRTIYFSDSPIVLAWPDSLDTTLPVLLAVSKDGRLYCWSGDNDPHSKDMNIGTIKQCAIASDRYLFIVGETYLFRIYIGMGSEGINSYEERIGNFQGKPSCVAVNSGKNQICIGTEEGRVWIVNTSSSESYCVHNGERPITSVAWSNYSQKIAVGDEDGRTFIYQNNDLCLVTSRENNVISAKILNNKSVLLKKNRSLEIVKKTHLEKEQINLSEWGLPIDFDVLDNLAIIISLNISEGDLYLQVVDLDEGAILFVIKPPLDEIVSMKNSWPMAETLPAIITDQMRVRIINRNGGIFFALGCPFGILIYDLFLPQKGSVLIVDNKYREIGLVTRLGAIGVECGTFEAVPSMGIIATYSVNNYLKICSKIILWNLSTLNATEISSVSSRNICQLHPTIFDKLLIGQNNGLLECIGYDGKLEMSTDFHKSKIVSIASSKDSDRACCISADGVLSLWDYKAGNIKARTFIDIDPVIVGFNIDESSVLAIDRSGEIHEWKIEGILHRKCEKLPREKSISDKVSALAEQIAQLQNMTKAESWGKADLILNNNSFFLNGSPQKEYWQSWLIVKKNQRLLSDHSRFILKDYKRSIIGSLITSGISMNSDKKIWEPIKNEFQRLLVERKIQEAEIFISLIPYNLYLLHDMRKIMIQSIQAIKKIENFKLLLSKGNIEDARKVIEEISMEDSLNELKESLSIKLDEYLSDLKKQIDILRQELNSMGIDNENLNKIAEKHQIFENNPFFYYGVLMQIKDHLTKNNKKNHKFWHFWRKK